MARIPYKPADIAEPEELIASIRARRGGRLLNLDRLLLYSPAFAAGWGAHLRAVRGELTVPPKLRELAICVVAALTGADYEFHHHAPELLAAGGTDAQVATLRGLPETPVDAARFDQTERAVVGLAEEMTRKVRLADTTFAAVSDALGDHQQVVELVGIIATYNMVSRFLVALDIEPEH